MRAERHFVLAISLLLAIVWAHSRVDASHHHHCNFFFFLLAFDVYFLWNWLKNKWQTSYGQSIHIFFVRNQIYSVYRTIFAISWDNYVQNTVIYCFFFLAASSTCSSTSTTSTSTSTSTKEFKESPKKPPKHPKHKKKKKRKHEIFIKGGENCQRTCRGLNWPCCVIHKKAPDAWYCIKYYARNKWGRCVPIKSYKCQKEKMPTCVCGPNCVGNPAAEEYQW